MAAIPGYERVVINQARVADTVNTQAISEAASGFNAVAQAMDAAAQVSLRIRDADDAATLNEMIITRERQKIDFEEAAKKQYEGAPDGFSAYFEKEMMKKDAATIRALPSRLQQPYKETTMRSNVNDYAQNKGWETDRRVAVVGDKIARAGTQSTSLAYTYGATGKPFEEIMKNIDATMVAGSGVLAPEKLSKFDEDLRSEAAKQYITGMAQVDPQAAQDLLSSGQMSKYMTTEAAQAAAKDIWSVTPDIDKLKQINNGKQPLSVRNNNPYNIRGADGNFKKFATPQDGLDAGHADMRVKISGKSAAMKRNFGENYQPTLANLISTWAPSSENDTQAYINTVSKETGIAPDQVLKESDIEKIGPAMVKVEGGQSAANYFVTGNTFAMLPAEDRIKELGNLSKYQEASNVQEVLAGNMLADPASKDQRDAISNSFSQAGGVNALTQKAPESVAVLTDYAKRFGVVPDSAKQVLRGFMINGRPEDKQFAYGVIGEIAKTAPQTLTMAGGFKKKEISDAAAFNALISAGAEPKFADDVIKQSNEPIMKDVRDLREKAIAKKVTELSDSKIISEFDNLLPFNAPSFADASQRDIMLSDYRRLYKEAYMLYGDEDAAKEVADKSIKAYGGVTNVGGKKLMKFPPENYYNVEGVEPEEVTQEITKQLEADLVTAGYAWKDYSLVPTVNAETKINNGQKPAYHVWVTLADGRIDMARDKETNMPLAVAFDMNPLLEKQKQARAQNMKNASVARENQAFYETMKAVKEPSATDKMVTSD